MKLQAISCFTRRAANAVRRFVFSLCVLLWKAVLLFFITMAVALTALAFNAALYVYRKFCERCTATVHNFFETYFYAELRERCSVLEGRFDEVHGQIGQLREELEGAAKTQQAAEKRTLHRLELLNQVMAEGNALLEKIALKEASSYGFVGTFHHHHHHTDDGHQSSGASSFGSEERVQLLTPPSSNSMLSSVPIDTILSHLNNGDGSGGHGCKGSCAFYGSEIYSLSPPAELSTMSNCGSPPPPPPPPPPPNFNYGKVSFKCTPRGSTTAQQSSTTAATSIAVQTSKFVVSESEIAAMRSKLKKVPAKRNMTAENDNIKKEDS